MRLDDLIPIFGGHIREAGGRRWLDTHVGGLRAFVVCRATQTGVTFALAVISPHARELDPFLAERPADNWCLREDPMAVPRLANGFVFTGCQGGVLFAMSTGPTSLENVVGALWDLARWARMPWCPVEIDEREWRRPHRARRFQRIFVVCVVVVVVLLVLGVLPTP